MCEFYIYKIADNAIIAFLFATALFYWRGGMGVGLFLNAKVVNQDRETLIKYNQYVALLTKKSQDIAPKEVAKNSIVEDRYKKSIRIYYGLAVANIIFVIGLFVLSYRLEEGVIGAVIAIAVGWQVMIILIFILSFILLLKFAHLKYAVIGVSDENYQHMEELLLEAKKSKVTRGEYADGAKKGK